MNYKEEKFIHGFEYPLKPSDLVFKYARGVINTIGNEIHQINEIFFFISGDAEIITECGSQKLQPNSIIVLPKNTYHNIVVSGDDRNYYRCVFNVNHIPWMDEFIDQKLTKFAILQNKDIAKLFFMLIEILESDKSELEKSIICKSAFGLIVHYINYEKDTIVSDQSKFNNPIVRQTIVYINENLEKPLTIPILAKAQNVSVSYLSQLFKKEMNLSIHKFILQKRLILARYKICNSDKPSEAAAKCGFNDYSGFYKQYKKAFGYYPSETIEKALQQQA